MKKRILSSIVALSLMLALASCGSQSQNTEGQSADTSSAESASASSEKSTEKESTSAKKKYKNISADTNPIGVDNISVKMNDNYPYIFCTIYKNGGDIEESIVEVTLELTDDNNEYIGEKTLTTKRSLTVEDSETVSDNLIWQIPDDKRSDEFLSKYRAKVVSIKETDVAEAEAAEELADLMSDIEWAITYDKKYNSALAMLEVAKEEYPDSKELKIFEAEIKDLLAKEGIDMEGNKITEEESTTNSAE